MHHESPARTLCGSARRERDGGEGRERGRETRAFLPQFFSLRPQTGPILPRPPFAAHRLGRPPHRSSPYHRPRSSVPPSSPANAQDSGARAHHAWSSRPAPPFFAAQVCRSRTFFCFSEAEGGKAARSVPLPVLHASVRHCTPCCSHFVVSRCGAPTRGAGRRVYVFSVFPLAEGGQGGRARRKRRRQRQPSSLGRGDFPRFGMLLFFKRFRFWMHYRPRWHVCARV